MRIWLISAILLTGCASIRDAPKEVFIPVSVPCIEAKDIPAKPQFIADADLAKMSDADLIISLRTEQLAYRGYTPLIESLLQGCVK